MRAPALPAPVEREPYVPVSWMAVAAAAVAAAFLLALLFAGYSALTSRRPLVVPELLVLPAIAIVLSFAARRIIDNSEGTRTGWLYGLNLVNAAWWVAVVGGLGYAAYLFAIDYSIRRDGENELQRWLASLTAADKDLEISINQAFLRTLEPGRRTGLRPENTEQLRSEFRNEYLQFRQCDLVRIASRNRGACTFEISGVREWATRPWGVDCVFGVTLRCPEGIFPLSIPVKGIEPQSPAEAAAGRQWSVVVPQQGYVITDRIQFTRYGAFLAALEASGGQYGRQFITHSSAGPHVQHFLYQRMIGPLEHEPFWAQLDRTTLARAALLGGLGSFSPFITAESVRFYRERFLRLPKDAPPSPEQQRLFGSIWNSYGLAPPQTRLRNNPDRHEILTVYDDRVEVSVPCELPFPGVGASALAAARGRLIVATSDPAVLGELQQLRAAVQTGSEPPARPEEFLNRNFRWRIRRLESDLYRIAPTPAMPGDVGG